MTDHPSWPKCLEHTKSKQKLQFSYPGFLKRSAMEPQALISQENHQNITYPPLLNPNHRIKVSDNPAQDDQAIDQQSMTDRRLKQCFIPSPNSSNSLFSSHHRFYSNANADTHSIVVLDSSHIGLIHDYGYKLILELQTGGKDKWEEIHQSFHQQQQDQKVDLSLIEPQQSHNIIENNGESNPLQVFYNQNSKGQVLRQDQDNPENSSEDNHDTYQFIPPPQTYDSQNPTFQQMQASLQNNILEVLKCQEEGSQLFEEFSADQLSQQVNNLEFPQSMLAEPNQM